MSDTSDNDLIERYLLEKLTDADRWKFETRLGDDREFARKFRLMKTFPELMSEQGRIEYGKILAKATTKVVKKKPSRFPKRRYLGGIAVLILMGVAISLFLIFKGITHQNENVGKQEMVVQKSNIKTEIHRVKDTAAVASRQQAERKEIGDVKASAVHKAIELLKPADGMKFSRKDMILFRWIQQTDSFTRFYIISDLHNQVVYWRGVRPGIREYKVPGDYLYPGKYHWYVGTEEEKRGFMVNE